jgi:hypothetical protein
MSINMPWRLKILAKLVLSQMPVPYGVWSRFKLFRHGAMDRLDYARSVFATHFALSGLSQLNQNGFTCLELGPGDSLLSALFARENGSTHTYLVDVASFALKEVEFYKRAAKDITDSSDSPVNWRTWDSIDSMLSDCRGEYLTSGLSSLKAIPDGSVDWSWSQAVLEHVRRSEFPATIRELRRVLKPGAMTTHRVDFQDHLGGALNNLRFTDGVWESELFASGGFYTNRLRYSEVIRAFQFAGFRLEFAEPNLWPVLPITRAKLDPAFRNLSDSDLQIRWADIVFRAV